MRSMSQSVGKPPKFVSKLVEKWKTVCLVCPVVALAYLALIILPEYNEPTRISENALLPALVAEHFSYNQRIAAFAKALHVEKNRAEYVKTQLEHYGIFAHMQQYEIKVSQYNETRTNVYGVIRASRSLSVESILVAVALDSERVEAAAMVLALSTYCREQLYWARDLVFVFVDGGPVGMDTFLAAYHGETRAHVKFDQVDNQGGSIVGAFVVKTTGTNFNDLELEYNMMNGQLPNLDLFNLFVRLADKFGLTPKIFNHAQQSSWSELAETVLQGMLTQAFTNVQGLHSVFGSYGIQAITVHAKGTNGHVSLSTFARICEGGLRSLNNILEKFHQSYFLYLLANARRFISVAYYMPMIGIMVAPLIVLALREWFSMAALSLPNSYLVFHLIGLASYFAGNFLVQQSNIDFDTYFYAHLSLLLIPYYLFVPCKQEDLNATRFFFYLELALLIGSVSLLNFSLAFCVSLIAVPVASLFSTLEMRRLNWIKGFFGFIVHPIVLFVAFRILLINPNEKTIDALRLLADSASQSYLLLSNITFPLMQICFIPLWSILFHFCSVNTS